MCQLTPAEHANCWVRTMNKTEYEELSSSLNGSYERCAASIGEFLDDISHYADSISGDMSEIEDMEEDLGWDGWRSGFSDVHEAWAQHQTACRELRRVIKEHQKTPQTAQI